ncbi:hypothetical protein Tco_0127744 [Tanacetum coccineum]
MYITLRAIYNYTHIIISAVTISCQLDSQLPILLSLLNTIIGVIPQRSLREAARQLLEQAPRSPKYVPDPMELEDHVLVYIPKPEHPEDLVPAEDEAPNKAYYNYVVMAQIRAATPSTYHPLLPSGTPPLLPIPLHAPSTSCGANIPKADTPPRKRILLTAPRPRCEVGESSVAAAAR